MSPTAEEVVAYGKSFLGLPYEDDGCRFLNCPNALHADCSGFVYAILHHFGIPFPTNTVLDWEWVLAHKSLCSIDTARHTPAGIAIRGRERGYGPLGHIVMFVGDGIHTIEASGHKLGIAELTFDDHRAIGYDGALIPGLPWGPSTHDHPKPHPLPPAHHSTGIDLGGIAAFVAACKKLTLRVGSSGPAVKFLQTALTNDGFACFADGDFGAKTASAVRGFQGSRRLTVDGVVGPRTWAALVP